MLNFEILNSKLFYPKLKRLLLTSVVCMANGSDLLDFAIFTIELHTNFSTRESFSSLFLIYVVFIFFLIFPHYVVLAIRRIRGGFSCQS